MPGGIGSARRRHSQAGACKAVDTVPAVARSPLRWPEGELRARSAAGSVPRGSHGVSALEAGRVPAGGHWPHTSGGLEKGQPLGRACAPQPLSTHGRGRQWEPGGAARPGVARSRGGKYAPGLWLCPPRAASNVSVVCPQAPPPDQGAPSQYQPPRMGAGPAACPEHLARAPPAAACTGTGRRPPDVCCHTASSGI